jgi:hypothetical protein
MKLKHFAGPPMTLATCASLAYCRAQQGFGGILTSGD